MKLKEWAEKNGYADVYADYVAHRDELREFYGDNTDDLELALSRLQENYPELFGDED